MILGINTTKQVTYLLVIDNHHITSAIANVLVEYYPTKLHRLDFEIFSKVGNLS
ncbi:MAG: hypothetical protein ACRCV0_07445 [Brevinema sp.]